MYVSSFIIGGCGYSQGVSIHVPGRVRGEGGGWSWGQKRLKGEEGGMRGGERPVMEGPACADT